MLFLNDLTSKMNTKVKLFQPNQLAKDELGGVKDRTFTNVGEVWAWQRDKTSTYRQVVADYVTTNTCYFLCWDFRGTYSITVDWQLEVGGHKYVINSITMIDDQRPHRLEIEATRIGGII